MGTTQDIIDRFVLLVMEYIHLVNVSDIIKSMDNSKEVVQLGFNALVHIFRICFSATGNVEVAGSYAERGTCCFLEYIEQIHKTSMSHNLDHLDVIQFVYSKTISDVYGNNSTSVDRLSNYLSLNVPEPSSGIEHSFLLDILPTITETVMWFDNAEISHMKRLELSHVYLQPFLPILLNIELSFPKNALLSLVRMAQDTIKMDYVQYTELLSAFLKHMKKIVRSGKLPPVATIRDKKWEMIIAYKAKTLPEVLAAEHVSNVDALVRMWVSL